MRIAALAVFAASAASLLAQLPPATQQQIATEGIEHSHVMEFQDHLCHDFGARLTGSLAFDRAAHWAKDQFAAMGLQARLEPWGQWQFGWDREQWMGRVVTPFELELQVATPAWTGSTRGIARGTLVATPATAEAVAALQLRLDQGESCWLWGPLPQKAPDVRKQLVALLDAGKLLGVAQSAASTGWNDKNFPNQIRVFGGGQGPQLPMVQRQVWPHAIVRDDQSQTIEQKLKEPTPVVVEFELRNRFRPGPIELVNVVADLVGSEHPEEIVVVCGHLDSWHQATGATDNGTGTCSTLEAARLLTVAGVKPKRTIRFLLWGGEEQGLLGSLQYVVRHRTEMAHVVAVFNHDGGTNWAHALTVPESEADDFKLVTQPLLDLLKPPQATHQGPVFTLNTVPVLQPAGGGSDHASFGSVGVPAFGWGQTGEVQYGRGWHSQWDTYSIVVPAYQRHTATVVALVAGGIASLDHALSRKGVERAKPGGLVNAQLVAETWLGVELDGLQVKTIAAGSLAAVAGLQAGDALQTVAGNAVADASALVAALRTAWEAGPEVDLGVQRAGKAVSLKLVRR